MESDVVGEWLLSEDVWVLINIPVLRVPSSVTVIEHSVFTVTISVASQGKAVVSDGLNVSVVSWHPSHELSGSVTRAVNSSKDVLTVTKGVSGKSIVSPVVGSDSLGSAIESIPGVLVIWVLIVNPDIAVVSEVQWSVSVNSGSDLELDTVSEWVGWVVDTLLVDVPALVLAIVAFVPNKVSVVSVGVTVNVQASDSQISNVSS